MNEIQALPEVTRFVVKVPFQYALPQNELRSYLTTAFPTRAFSFERHEDANAKRISLLPVMEDSKGKPHICRLPDRSIVSRIHEVLNEFFIEIEARSA